MFNTCHSHDRESVNTGKLQYPSAVLEVVFTQYTYKFFKNIHGSAAYCQHELHEVFVMLKVLGVPTWFLTLSAADPHWPEIKQAVGIQLGKRFTRVKCLL